MKLKDLMKKATSGHSNTMYENIDKIDNQYVLFRVLNGKKQVYNISNNLNEVLDQRDDINKNGWPIWESDKLIQGNTIIKKTNQIITNPVEEINEKIQYNNKGNSKKRLFNLSDENLDYGEIYSNSKDKKNPELKISKLAVIDKHKFLTKNKNSYTLSRIINGKKNYYGSYSSLSDANYVKEYLIRHNWEISPEEIKNKFKHLIYKKYETSKKKLPKNKTTSLDLEADQIRRNREKYRDLINSIEKKFNVDVVIKKLEDLDNEVMILTPKNKKLDNEERSEIRSSIKQYINDKGHSFEITIMYRTFFEKIEK